MGDLNQLLLIERNRDLVRPPILEVGSKDYGSTPDFRALFPEQRYVGVDMAEGKGVDVAADLIGDFDSVDRAVGGMRFNTVICFSVLEHCRNPFRMGETITRLTRDEGIVFVSVPFSWQIHAYPSDYWRFTAEGIKEIFPAFEFDPARCCMSTSETGQIKPIDEFMYRAELSVSSALRRGEYGFARSLLVRLVRRLRLFPFIFDYRYLHPPVMVNMIGRKRPAG
jgi:hypothetical protein